MKNTFGTAVSVTIFGESHGAAVGAVIDGLAAGIPIDRKDIAEQMSRRRAKADGLSTTRIEADSVEFVSGVHNNHTTGTPVTLLIHNRNTRSEDYAKTADLLRPGHADFTAYAKYNGWQDARGGGHFSGRITAAVVAAGAVCRSVLKAKGVEIATHLSRCGGVEDLPFSTQQEELRQQQKMLNGMDFATISKAAGQSMQESIRAAGREGDSVGGILETAVTGLAAGIGEPFFESVESVLAQLMFSIPAVKGIEFGAGFGFADLKGSTANDPFRMEGDSVITATNHNGGINGGITNGMPLVFRTVVKPTPSIYQQQQTVDYTNKQNAVLQIHGRHDPCILPRARAVQDAMCAIGLLDLYTQRFGTVWHTTEEAKCSTD